MRPQWWCAGTLAVAALAGCSPAGGAADEPREDGVVLPVTAVRDAVISSHPLGDVGIGALVAGEQAGATCFVPAATTNIGSSGSAVQVRVNGDTGYVPVQMVDPETDEPAVFLEQGERWLRNNLPSC